MRARSSRSWPLVIAALAAGVVALLWIARENEERTAPELVDRSGVLEPVAPVELRSLSEIGEESSAAAVERSAEAPPQRTAEPAERGPGVSVHVQDREGRPLAGISVALVVPEPPMRLYTTRTTTTNLPEDREGAQGRLEGLISRAILGRAFAWSTRRWDAEASVWDRGIFEQSRLSVVALATFLDPDPELPLSSSSFEITSPDAITRTFTNEQGDAWFPLQGELYTFVRGAPQALDAELEVPGASDRRQRFTCAYQQSTRLVFTLQAPCRFALELTGSQDHQPPEVELRWTEGGEDRSRAIGPALPLRPGERLEAWADGMGPAFLSARVPLALAPPVRIELAANELGRSQVIPIDVLSRLALVRLRIEDRSGAPIRSQPLCGDLESEGWRAEQRFSTNAEGELVLWIDASAGLTSRRFLRLRRWRNEGFASADDEDAVHVDVSGVLPARRPVDLGAHRLGSDPTLIEGRVVDENGRALAGADLAIEPRGTRLQSDAQGGFHLRGVPRENELTVVAAKDGWCLRAAQKVSAPATGVELRLESGGELGGTLRAPQELLQERSFAAVFAATTAEDRFWICRTSLGPGATLKFPTLPRGPGRLWLGYDKLPLLETPVEIGAEPTDLGKIDLGSAIRRFELEVHPADRTINTSPPLELTLHDGATKLGTVRTTVGPDRRARFWIPRRAQHYHATCAGESRSGSIEENPPTPWVLSR